MRPGFERTEVLITVKTYPHPSTRYQETVCTAGIDREGQWVRLYPIDFRYRPAAQQFRKWQWIEVGLEPRGAGPDQRPESRRPDLESLRVLGDPIPTRGDWRRRSAVIDPMPHHTIDELKALYERDRTSLGIVRPTRVKDLVAEPVSREWSPRQEARWAQLRLFGHRKLLTKLPYRFSYVFECGDPPREHKLSMLDWELGMRFLKARAESGSEAAAVQDVREKFLGEICRDDKDTRFFVGTRHPYNTWMVLGTFWPPKPRQATLF